MGFRTLLAIVILTALSTNDASAQGKLVFLNGKEKRFTTAEVKGEFIVYQPEGTKKASTRKADLYNVFSIYKDDGSEQVVYKPDTADGDPSVLEVRDYIKGEIFAEGYYNKPLNFWGGVGVGLGSSVAGFYGIPIPLVYTTIIGQFNPKPPPAIDNAIGEIPSEAYIAGYQRKARNMKIKSSLIGGLIGFSVGITTLVLVLGDE